MLPAEMVFDEEHYIEDARAIIGGEETERPEHPSLGKLFIISGMLIFGEDNPWGWRFFPIIFGTISIALFYLICRKLEMSQKASLIATFLLAFENLTFIQAGVAMLDVYFLTFMLASFLLYLKSKHLLSGISVGLSSLAKLVGVMAFPTIFLHWIITGWEKSWRFLVLIIAAPASFVLFMMPFDYFTFGRFINPIARAEDMVNQMSSITFDLSPEAASRPWDWILNYEILYYWYDPHYVGAISQSIWALIIPVVCYLIYRSIRRNNAGVFGLMWFVSIYLFWVVLSLAVDRITYVFYFYPIIGAICLGLGLALSQLLDVWKDKVPGRFRWGAWVLVAGYLAFHIVIFVLYSPLFSIGGYYSPLAPAA